MKFLCQGIDSSKTLILDYNLLQKNLSNLNTDQNLKSAFKKLIKKADKLIEINKIYSVTEKLENPPSGDKRDYMSIGPYWWPDPSKPNGLPYIRRDGETNPDYNNIKDSKYLDKLEEDVEVLSLAYFYTKNENYADFCSKLLKTWFLNDLTKMNPNLNFGQAIKGLNAGRGTGIIETRELYKVIDATILLQGCKSWTDKDHSELKKWFQEYLNWLLTSAIGIEEGKSTNNHGTYYSFQIMNFALFTNNLEIYNKEIELVKKRIDFQIHSDGSQPEELKRTKSWDYVNMNLYGFFLIARLTENVSIDLYNYKSKNNVGMKEAFDWLIPYFENYKNWRFQQIKDFKFNNSIKLLLSAARAYKNDEYVLKAKKMDNKNYLNEINQLTF